MRLAALPFGVVGWWVLVAHAAAQDGAAGPAVDPWVAWAAGTIGPWGAASVIAWRAMQLGGRFVDVLDRAIVEAGRWRELAPGASLRIEHSHEGLERVRLELTPPGEDQDLPTSSTPGRAGRRA